jgi:hypothetical protein
MASPYVRFRPIADIDLPWHAFEMARSNWFCIAGAVTFAVGCQTVPSQRGAPVFQNPANFTGQTVTVCGFLIGPANILQSRSDVNVGLSVDGGVHARALARLGERAPVCLTGTISYVGCETDVCMGAAFDYMIHVTELR